MRTVRFLHNHSPYNGGELAGFEDARADELIELGIAVDVSDDPAAVDEVVPAPTIIEEVDLVTPRRKGKK